MKETTKFKKWVERVRPKRGLVCHFYIPESNKPYYDKLDYVLFNLISNAKEWVVKGTPDHGITSRSGKKSRVPCLNCFEVDSDFVDAIIDLQDINNHKFEFGVVFNKNCLRKYFGRGQVIDVEAKIPRPIPFAPYCHRYDSPTNRYGALKPFHWCQVVRIEIDKNIFRSCPILAIPGKAIMGFLIKESDVVAARELLDSKRLGSVPIFPIL